MEFFLYSKSECQLCDDFLTGVRELLNPPAHVCHVINIDNDPDLQQRYGARVPVLVAGNTELCEQVFNQDVITAFLAKQAS